MLHPNPLCFRTPFPCTLYAFFLVQFAAKSLQELRVLSENIAFFAEVLCHVGLVLSNVYFLSSAQCTLCQDLKQENRLLFYHLSAMFSLDLI